MKLDGAQPSKIVEFVGPFRVQGAHIQGGHLLQHARLCLCSPNSHCIQDVPVRAAQFGAFSGAQGQVVGAVVKFELL